MTGRIFIQVILPLRLEWEPFYYQEIELSESAGDASGLFPVTSTGSVTERDKEQVRVGDRVRVNFAGKEYVGVVSMADAGKQAEEMGIVDKVKPILGMAEGLEPVTKEEIELWRQIAEYYLCTVGEVYKAAYPAQKVEKEVVQARQEALKVEREEKNRTKIADKIKRLEERAEKKAELAAKARKSESRERYLAEKEMLEGEIGLLVRELTSMVGELCRTTGSVTGYGDSVTYHQDEEPIGGSIIETSEGTEKEISLSAAQEEAYSKIKEIFAKGKPALLHGVTGSGKTEIYLKLAQETLAMGRNVLYLVPEIALSRQLEDRISETFPELLVFHSGETMSRKREVATVLRHAGEPAEGKGYVVLGTRSAIFLPHKNLGLVIVDEEHDTSYKQDSPAPRYNGRETAIMMAKIFGANVILGSATPSLESLYNCSVGRYGLVTLNKRFYDAADSDIEIIDTIAERRKNGMIGNFSRKLIEHIGKCLGEQRQVLILRERRASGALLCLDVTESIVDEAIEKGCNLIVSHHPLVFHPLKRLTYADYVQRAVAKAIKNDITILSMHTNMDNAEGGVNFKIAEKMDLQ